MTLLQRELEKAGAKSQVNAAASRNSTPIYVQNVSDLLKDEQFDDREQIHPPTKAMKTWDRFGIRPSQEPNVHVLDSSAKKKKSKSRTGGETELNAADRTNTTLATAVVSYDRSYHEIDSILQDSQQATT